MYDNNRLLLIDSGRQDKEALDVYVGQLQNHWNFVDVLSPTSLVEKLSWPFFIVKKGLDLFSKNKYDHILVREHPLLLNGIGALLLHKATKRPYIVEINRSNQLSSPSRLPDRIGNLLMRWFFRFEAKFAKAVLVPDKADGADFIYRCSNQSDKVMCLNPFLGYSGEEQSVELNDYASTISQLFRKI